MAVGHALVAKAIQYDQKGGGQRDAFSVASGFFKAEGTPAEVLIIERYWKILLG